ncbi:MAG: glucokinase, partial [Nitrospinaceae bacterium]
ELSVLQAGNAAEEGRIAVVAAGTGMGQAFLIPDGRGRYVVLDSEGGHCDFAPRHKLEADLLQFLLGSLERVSVERVLSGAGLFGIYRFVKEYFSLEEPEWLARELEENDPGVVVTRNGMEKKSPACEKALDLFVSLYGAMAGNLALQFLSSGGVYIGGGIAPKIVSRIKSGGFMEAFLSKGRFRPFLETVPVKVILNDRASLLGAAHYALGKKFVR